MDPTNLYAMPYGTLRLVKPLNAIEIGTPIHAQTHFMLSASEAKEFAPIPDARMQNGYSLYCISRY